jgi:hypothetical protein
MLFYGTPRTVPLDLPVWWYYCRPGGGGVVVVGVRVGNGGDETRSGAGWMLKLLLVLMLVLVLMLRPVLMWC